MNTLWTRCGLVICALLLLANHGIGQSREPAGEAKPRTWQQVMYLGGAIGVMGRSLGWDNTLTISADKIDFKSKNGPAFSIETSWITSFAYFGPKRTNDDAVYAAAFLTGPLGALIANYKAKSTDHFVGVEYTPPGRERSGVLLRLHKNNSTEIMEVLRTVIKSPEVTARPPRTSDGH